ncbi:DMT family transporter [Microbaculum marinum]|uniref:EamA family transporter n=1 Tax=Microbaculum marinum TaxID=1764581 RepID=A0AAW9RC95_9HYPH
MNKISAPMGAVEWALLLVLSLLWGGSFLFAKVAVGELPPLTVAFLRVSIAAATLVAIVRIRGLGMPSGREWLPFLVMGTINNVIPFGLLFWAMTQVTSGLAAILNATTPLFTVLCAHVLTADERMTPQKLAGVLIGLGGVAVMIGLDTLSGLGLDVLAQLACVGAAVSYAFATIWGRRLSGRPPLVVAAGQVTSSSILLLPIILVVDTPWRLSAPSAATAGAILALALAATALAYLIYFRILQTAGSTNLSLVTFLIPVSALALGALLLGETVTASNLAGMVLIGIGLAAIDGRPFSAIRAVAAGRRVRAR